MPDRTTINGRRQDPGAYVNGKQLRCTCGNTTKWDRMIVDRGRMTADCGDCGAHCKV
ncbi:hypothetical protein [Actinomadura macrotermitis]|uniref:Uncharacterized protein n=1 Tax=Actinomadura macrotermitis TaxID=2585200 RepID=A0A7K0C8W6_9ACTN|nr:hypothetical protein [Actinomadura macrotermitis]MQY09890.1 hypothetical protein [Actinomadura macrotermitis]